MKALALCDGFSSDQSDGWIGSLSSVYSRPRISWLIGLIVFYLILNLTILHRTVSHPDLAEKMQTKDSRQYIEIAQQFAEGHFDMAYVQYMPHRQPLYSLALAPVIRLWGVDAFKLGLVNCFIGLLLLCGLYGGLLGLFRSTTVAVLLCLALIANPFLVDKISCRLMTEPLHILILTALNFVFLAYLRQPRLGKLIGIGALCALDYLARTNGLFVTAAVFGSLFVFEVGRRGYRYWQDRQFEMKEILVLLRNYCLTGLIWIVVLTPSWLPRWHYFQNPIHHGYLSNFMWVDSYEQGHTGQAVSDFTWKDYARTHGFHDFVNRCVSGSYRVFWDIPRHTEHIRVLYFLALGGFVCALVSRQPELGLLALSFLIQILPVVWTSASAPSPRIAYGTMLPFELFFAADFLNRLRILIAHRLQKSPEIAEH